MSTALTARPPAPPPWWEEIRQAITGLARRCPDRPAVIDSTATLTFGELWRAARQRQPGGAAHPAPVLPIPARSNADFFVDVVAAWLRGQTPMPLADRPPADLLDSLLDPPTASIGNCQPWKAVTAVCAGSYAPMVTHGEPPTTTRKAQALGLRPGAVAFFCSPMHLNGPFEFALRHLLLGGTVLVAPRFTPAVWTAMATAYRAQWAFVVPTQMRQLLAAVEHPALSAATTSLEQLVHSSEPCSAELWSRFADILGAQRLAEYYGTACYDGTLTHSGAAGGLPIDGAQLRVVDSGGLPVPPNTVGTIEGRSRTGLVSHTAAACLAAGAWQSVGDRGRLSVDGRLMLESVATPGRAIVGGINVALARIEAVLAEHPAVATCEVRAEPDDDYGSVIVVRAYTDDSQLSADVLDAHCVARLSSAERPRRIEVEPVAQTVLGQAAGWS